MTVYMPLRIVTFDDPRLREKATPVEHPRLVKAVRLAFSMLEIMRRFDGLGLAANQIGSPDSLFVMEVETPRVFINPEIVAYSPDMEESVEGCLSVPGVTAIIPRSTSISLKYDDMDGETRFEDLAGLEARVVQHEVDHLNGMYFFDRLSDGQRAQVIDAFNNTKRRTSH